jgi:hypothetical protein
MEGAHGNLSNAELAELAALADGSLPRAKQAAVAVAVERSADLRELLDEQRVAVAAVRALDAPAPASLRARLEATPRAPERRRARALRVGAALAATALLALALLPGSQPDAPTVLEAAALADRGANASAPRGDRRRPERLEARVAGVPFPAYGPQLGWHAAGTRSDELSGRVTRTVFYERRGRQASYTIVSGDALGWPPGAQRRLRAGVTFRVVEHGSRTIVSWLREGHTCVLSSDDAARGQLLMLAAWKSAGTVPS